MIPVNVVCLLGPLTCHDVRQTPLTCGQHLTEAVSAEGFTLENSHLATTSATMRILFFVATLATLFGASVPATMSGECNQNFLMFSYVNLTLPAPRWRRKQCSKLCFYLADYDADQALGPVRRPNAKIINENRNALVKCLCGGPPAVMISNKARGRLLGAESKTAATHAAMSSNRRQMSQMFLCFSQG